MDLLRNPDEIEELSQNMYESFITLKEVSINQRTLRTGDALRRHPARRLRAQMTTEIF